mgnify:CR=1 FL=1
MRDTYKKVFDEVKVGDEVVEEVLSQSKNRFPVKYIVLAACFAAVILAGAGIFANNNPPKNDETEVISASHALDSAEKEEIVRYVSKEISCGGKKVKINASVVADGHAGDMHIYMAKHRVYSAERFEKILLGENGMFNGNKEDASIGFPLGSGINFGVYNYLSADNKPTARGAGYAKGCETSFDDAKRISDEFLKAEGSADYVFVSGEVCDPIAYGGECAPMGYYEFRYIQYADGFPVESVTSNVYAGTASELTVQVDDRGIVFVRMSGLDLSEKEKPEKMIMLDEAIDLIEKSLDELWLSEYAPIIEIRLEYLLDEAENGELMLFPCWRFCVDKTQLLTLPLEVQRENDTNDLCMNAVTGEMFRTMERYPAFQIAE